MLRPAFALALKAHWVSVNPFNFAMTKKAYGGTKTRDALERKDMRRFLDFVQLDKHFRRYYDGIFILFNTGLRISEFCGLTPDDIDFSEHVIHVRRHTFCSNCVGAEMSLTTPLLHHYGTSLK